jgi:CRP-like cAMP-binding protein
VIEPGSLVGEIGLLLGTPANADVVAAGDTVVHRIDDAADLFIAHPEFGRHLAVVLARRLRQVTTFLGDIEQQFAGRSGMLGLVPTVLTELLSGSVGDVDPGSERELDSPY